MHFTLEKNYIRGNNKIGNGLNKSHPIEYLILPARFSFIDFYLTLGGHLFKGCIYPLDEKYTIDYTYNRDYYYDYNKERLWK